MKVPFATIHIDEAVGQGHCQDRNMYLGTIIRILISMLSIWQVIVFEAF